MVNYAFLRALLLQGQLLYAVQDLEACVKHGVECLKKFLSDTQGFCFVLNNYFQSCEAFDLSSIPPSFPLIFTCALSCVYSHAHTKHNTNGFF